MQFLLFFIIPIKAKWLGIINAVYLLWRNYRGGICSTVSFGSDDSDADSGGHHRPSGLCGHGSGVPWQLPDFLLQYENAMRRYSPKEVHRRQVYNRSVQQGEKRASVHRCAVCGRTEKDGDDLVFRYCSKCNGNYEYCQDHLFTHEHVRIDIKQTSFIQFV